MLNKLENATIVLGSVIGISQIKEVLGIIILVVQAILIIWKAIEKFNNAKTNKDKIKAIEEAQQAIDNITKKKGE